MTIGRIVKVGGCNRDEELNRLHGTNYSLHDVDLSVECDGYDDMKEWVLSKGGVLKQETPLFYTLKAKWPTMEYGAKVIDVACSRVEGPYTDGRHPDPEFVKMTSIEEDLMRRDLTVNAIGVDTATGEVYDPAGGLQDCKIKRLQFVGEPWDRVTEDALRVVRAFRFMITRDLWVVDGTSGHTWSVLVAPGPAAHITHTVSRERMWEELDKMFRCNTIEALKLVRMLPNHTFLAMFPDGVWLKPTQGKK